MKSVRLQERALWAGVLALWGCADALDIWDAEDVFGFLGFAFLLQWRLFNSRCHVCIRDH